MSENQPGDESLRKEFETLGKNLVEAMRSAWEAPESRRFREEITTGLVDLGGMLKREADELSSSPAANKVRSSVDQVGEKLRAPEVQDKVRSELIGALQSVNTELQKVIERWSAPASAPASEQPAAGDPTGGADAAAAGFPAPDFAQPAPGDADVAGFDDETQGQA